MKFVNLSLYISNAETECNVPSKSHLLVTFFRVLYIVAKYMSLFSFVIKILYSCEALP